MNPKHRKKLVHEGGYAAEVELIEEEKVATGTVISGKVVVDDPSFTDGTEVFVVTREHEEIVRLSPEELAELEAGIAEADRGETISGDEFFARLRRYG